HARRRADDARTGLWLDREHRVRGGTARLGGRRGLTRVEARRGRPHEVHHVAPGPTITNIEASFASPLGAERVRQAMAILPDAAEAEALAASITFLLSDDGVDIHSRGLA